MPSYTVLGRVVGANGAPIANATVTVYEVFDLMGTPLVKGAPVLTDSAGNYSISWAESVAPSLPWDLFVRATDGATTTDSALINDLDATATVDVVLSTEPYTGRSEWDRLTAKLAPLIAGTPTKDIPVDRIEWLARRADVFPTHLGFYIQAHRLADQRTVKPQTCYAFLRAGHPADLPSLLRIGERQWESALRNSWQHQILSLPGDGSATAMDAEVSAEVAAMRELVVDAAVTAPTGSAITQRTLFDATGLVEADQRTFMETWVARTGSLAQFWSDLTTALSGDTAKVDRFQFTIQAATLVGHDVDVLAKLEYERSQATISTVRDLAAWSASDWDGFLVTHSLAAPSTVPGADAAAKRQNYARALSHVVEDSYPTLTLRHSIDRDAQGAGAPAHTTHLVTFLTNNPSFDITGSTIAHYLDGAADPWLGILPADQSDARANLELVQRVYRLTPRIGRYASTKVLLDNGIESAAGVVAYTRVEFIEQFGPSLPSDDHDADELAGRIWDHAAQIHSAAIGLASQLALGKTKSDFLPLAIAGPEQFENEADGLGELATILGGLDYCACEHCRSVFSPAAYLADLLAFLRDRPAKLAANAFEALSERRPDIRHILLDCANTNTPLPYIDLVNELLEAKFSGELVAPGTSHQTTWTSDELRIHPEHLDYEIYDGTTPVSSPITGLVYPWNLPFSLPLVEARTYLEHLSVPRAELLAVFEPKTPSAAYHDSLAAERLGLNATEYEIVTGTYAGNASNDDREYWGYDLADNNWAAILNGTDDPAGDVGELLRRGRYTLDELREYLALDFVGPHTILWDESCQLSDATIPTLNEAALDRLGRLTRLQRRWKIPARMLNVLIVDACGGTLDAAAGRKLGDMAQVNARLGLAWDELATLWSTVIDARSYADAPRSLYRRRFLSKEFETIDANVLTDFEPSGSELGGQANPAVDMSPGQRAVVQSALGLSTEELDAFASSGLANNEFSFANLTALFRCAVLARSLRLPAELFSIVVALTGADPFASPSATLDFIAQVDGIRASGLSVTMLDWLLRHEGDAPFDEEQTGRELAELARGLATVVEESAQLQDPDGTALATNLAQLLSPADVTTTLEIVDQTSGLGDVAQNQHIDDKLGPYLDATLAKDILVNDTIAALPLRRTWLLTQIVSYQRRRALVVDTLAVRFGLSAELTDRLAFTDELGLTVLTSPGGGDSLGSVFLPVFADEGAIATGLTSLTHVDEFKAWTRMAKAATLATAFALQPGEAHWYSSHAAWLSLDGMPLVDADPDASFDAWDRLRQALGLRSLYRPGELAHQQMADALSLADGLAILADHTGWDAVQLEKTTTALGYDLADLDAELALTRLRLAAETAAKLGVDLDTSDPLVAQELDTARHWATFAPSMAQSAAIKAAARAKHDEAQWQKTAAPLRDAIREQQRDALVDAVLATDASLADTNAVFEHLLVDVEMSACMLTSRIKLAISSVQIFIHRAMLHLEYDDLTFESEALSRWEWMKNYRVWEANRKVFLYPENWIEPELRPNKTPEFEALETTLMQGVIDQSRVEKALVNYLDRLDRVSQLEVMGVYEKYGQLWVLGRTATKPHEWFVRRRRSSGAWDPWEEVPVKIDGDAVALILHQRRVHLFWAERHEAPSDGSTKWDYRISHTERSDDGWSKVSVSEPSQASGIWGNYGLHAWELGHEIRLGVIMDGIFSTPLIKSAFSFDASDRKVRYLGSSFADSPYWEPLDGYGAILDENALVALQPGYIIEGQRYVNRSFMPGSGGFVNQNGDVVASGTQFIQGDYDAPLFENRSSSDDFPALIHQADVWTVNASAKFLPVIYDDRRRKYLLEPVAQFDNASDEGDEADINALGNLEITGYWDCPPEDPKVAPQLEPPLDVAQGVRDGLTKLEVWSGVVPGQILGSQELEFINDPVANEGQGGNFLAKAEGDAQAIVDPINNVANNYPASPTAFKLRIEALYHPGARLMVEALAKQGLDGLFPSSLASPLFRQQASSDPFVPSELDINPDIVEGLTPLEEFDFRFDGPYGLYNWELFFHVPMLIASKLSTEQRFDEARRWHHLIFNPIELVDQPGETETSKFWRLRPFVEQAGELAKDQLKIMLGIGATQAQQQAAIEAFSQQVEVWKDNPFDPHALARIRPGVYQRALLRKYIDNLIAWADNLFRRDTIESINEATILYILVAQLLGPRPQQVPAAEGAAQSFDDLVNAGLDAFSNALVQLEGWVTLPNTGAKKLGCPPSEDPGPWVRVPTLTRFWYFCYPPNAELLAYWDTIEDRLWKIRHCRNIEGITRQLPLFQPPIDPGLLVQAAAAGVDIQSVLAELDSGLPPYRFRSVHSRAVAFTSSLRALGAELLAALEKRDAEHLSRLRAGHELELLAQISEIRRRQVREAKRTLESLEAARVVIDERGRHYSGLIDNGYLAGESEHFTLAKKAQGKRRASAQATIVGSVLGSIPQIALPPSFGGLHLSNIANAVGTNFSMEAAGFDFDANRASLTASFERRAQDWELQRGQAEKELARIDRDILAAKIRVEIAEKELANHLVQAENSRELDREMRDKFSNLELYDWMIGQLSTLYFQTYQLAFDLAKRAERAYRFELALSSDEQPIIKYGYWDSLRKGLLAGQRLNHDLERLDLAYMDRDVREFELRKSASLAELDPGALRNLQESGSCSFGLSELLFDLDHPGHYLRRIRSIRLTIPAVVGPYTSLGARLQLDSHKTRVSPDVNGDYDNESVVGRFVTGYGSGEAIATSTAIADGGLFNLDFRDERYLPFEYAGVISDWTLSLPDRVRKFDYRSISDVVVHIDYTARDGGELRGDAENNAFAKLISNDPNLVFTQLIVVNQAFPNEWEQFLAVPPSGPQELSLPVTLNDFDYLAQRQGVEVVGLDFALLLERGVSAGATMTMTPSVGVGDLVLPDNGNDEFMAASVDNLTEQPETWTLSLSLADAAAPAGLADGTRLDRTKVAGMLMVIRYTLNNS